MTVGTVHWNWQGAGQDVDVHVDVPAGAAADAPLVILLHGTGGDISDMSDPHTHPGFTFEHVFPLTIRDRGWHDYPNVGFWSLGIDPDVQVQGWAPYLLGHGFPVLNYSQVDNQGHLTKTAAELIAVLMAIQDRHDGTAGSLSLFDEVKDRDIVLLSHSRGGVLARTVLVDLRDSGATILSRITKCITLHAPHQGSTLADVMVGLSSALAGAKQVVMGLSMSGSSKSAALVAVDGVIDFLQAQVGHEAYQDFAVGAPYLFALALREPVAGVEYFTFGGTRAVLLNVRGWAFTPESALPQFNLPPFHWSTAYVPLLPLPPPLVVPAPEVTDGVGDVLVASPNAMLPFALHWNNYINHAEALWDPALKLQVLGLLGGSPLPSTFVITSIVADAGDPDRAIDAFCGTGSTGSPWRVSLAEALALIDRGHPFFTRLVAGGPLGPIQVVRRRDGTRYLRKFPGAPGPNLSDLPRQH